MLIMITDTKLLLPGLAKTVELSYPNLILLSPSERCQTAKRNETAHRNLRDTCWTAFSTKCKVQREFATGFPALQNSYKRAYSGWRWVGAMYYNTSMQKKIIDVITHPRHGGRLTAKAVLCVRFVLCFAL